MATTTAVGTVKPVTGSTASTAASSAPVPARVTAESSKAFSALVAKVSAEFSEADSRLPAAPDAKSILGLPDEFIAKLARRIFQETFGSPAFLEALIAEVVKIVRAAHGPVRRNHVALASATGTGDGKVVGTVRAATPSA